MTFTVAVPEAVAGELFEALSVADETAWTFVARQALDGSLLLARELRPVPTEAYVERGPRRLRISSSGFMPAFASAASDELSVPVFVHTHPGGGPAPSELDDGVDASLRDLALSRTGRSAYASLIVAGTADRPAVSGRFWRSSAANVEQLDRLRAAGPHLRTVLSDRTDRPRPAEMFDRHIRAFGADGQGLLSQLSVGVVGAGGTGSPIIEQLARLGVGRIVVVDHDTVDETNLTRIHQSTRADVGRLKVDVARDSAQSYGTGTVVEAIAEKGLSSTVIQRLAGCDLIFGCTDDNAGRLVLSKLAYHYLVPVIDCGVKVSAADGHVHGVHGRVTVIAPGTPCLNCRGQIDMGLVAAEMMDAEERARRTAEGYVAGLEDHAPAVVPFTTMTSAIAVNEMLGRLFGYAVEPLPGQLHIGMHDRSIRSQGRPAMANHYCQDPSKWALGDTTPPLGITGLQG